MNKIIIKSFLLLFLFSLIKCQNTNFPTVPADKNLGACICDLTVDVCDLNCCCDTKCSTADVNSFTVCVDEVIANQIYNQRLCVPKSQIFTTNTPYIIESFQDLLCLSLDNYAALNYYQQPPFLTSTQISQLVNLAVPLKDLQNAQSSLYYKYSSSTYKLNDPLWVLTNLNTIGYLALPKSIDNGNCEIKGPLTYLGSKTSSCQYNNLKNLCTPTTPFLNFNYFVTTNALLKNSNSIINCVKQFNIVDQTTSLYQTCKDYIIKFNEPSCTLADGTKLTNCGSSLNNLILDNVNAKCVNLVKTVTYTIKYLNPDGIISADVNIEFAESKLTDPFKQTFNIVFQPSTTKTTSGSSYKRSGNPGYIVGEPIVAGILNTTSSIIILNQDSTTWFTIPKQDINGKCSKSASRASIKFGQNFVTDCIFEQDITNIDCTSLQNDIYEIIVGSAGTRPTHVATFGNSDIQKPGAWVQIDKINQQNTPTRDDVYKGVCNQMVTSASINIVYANAGDISNPQPMILYVGYEWGSAEKVAYQCFGQTCSNNLRFRVTTKVTFIDVSQPPEFIESKISKPQLKLPENFFYPFILSTSDSYCVHKSIILVNTLILAIIPLIINKILF